MKGNLISVIVPVYKVEKYLCKCVDSILAQTYTNLEIILVDDGSPDNCGKICDEYAEKDSRVKVIHQENGGLSAARNAGLDIATGDYIGFVDSDDYIEFNMYEELYKAIKEYNSDLSICGIKKFGMENRAEFYGNICLSKYDFIKALLKDEIRSYVWNKLYSKDLFSNIRFPVGEIYEDVKIMHNIGEHVSQVALTNETFYNYRIRKDSITFTNKGRDALDYLTAAHSRSEEYKDTVYYPYAVTGEFRCLRLLVSDMSVVRQNRLLYKELHNESKMLFRICKKQMTGLQKAVSYLFIVSPRIYYYCKRTILKISTLFTNGKDQKAV